MDVNIFKAIADIALGAKKRQDEEYSAFLAFYRELVETLPTEVTTLFGSMPRRVIENDEVVSYNIMLTATNFVWWKAKIEKTGTRFTTGPVVTRLAMLDHISKKAETNSLSPEQRKALLALLLEAGQA